MVYGSVCSGIGCEAVAWEPLGWRTGFFAETAAFPSAVLAHRFPRVPNLGDFTKIEPSQHGPIDLLVGGTPCQSFSVAGLRGGLGDGRGNLALEFLRLAARARPRWVVWENVPGVLSSNEGRDFGSILGGLAKLGYEFAYRILDAQYVRVDGFAGAVPQRRRRVFVIGYFGDWRRPAAVLFERSCLSRNFAPRRQAGEDAAPTLSSRPSGGGGLGTDFDCDGGLIAHTLNAKGGSGRSDAESETFVAHTLRGEGFDASEDWSGRGTPIIAVREPRPWPVAFSAKDNGADAGDDTANIRAASASVRRITPEEAEALQGLPRGYTLVPYRGRPAKDGPRYKAIGNGMAVNVMRWIGLRIQAVND